MRPFVLVVSLGLLASSVLADGVPVPARAVRLQTPAINLVPIVLDELPEGCRPIAKQASSPSLSVALGARIALANCVATDATAPLKLCDCADSIKELDDAVAPSIALLDEVAAAGDPQNAVFAEYAKAELYAGMKIRMASAIPPVDGTTDAIALRDARKALLDAQLVPWDDAITAADEHVVALAKSTPSLVKQPATKAAIEASKRRLAAVATLTATTP